MAPWLDRRLLIGVFVGITVGAPLGGMVSRFSDSMAWQILPVILLAVFWTWIWTRQRRRTSGGMR